MRRRTKVLAWTLGSIGAVVMLLIVAVLIAGNTAAGRGMIERVTFRLTGGMVKLTGLGADSFPSQLTLDRLQLIDRDGVWLTADRIAIQWSPWALFERRIAVDRVAAARVDMERVPLPGPSDGGPVSIPHIDVAQFTLDVVQLGAQLVGKPATLSAHGGGRLHALDDAAADAVVRRTDTDGEYTVHFKFDPKRMDGELEVHEPASGPLENILQVPGLGALSANLKINGPRNAERIDFTLHAGELSASAQGNLDLKKFSADLTYSLESPPVSPRADLRWQHVSLKGRWQGTLSDPRADGHLQADKLQLPGGTLIGAVRADLAAADGTITLKGIVEGLHIPGPEPSLLEKDPLQLEASWHVKEAARPLEVTAEHRLFSLRARAITAGPLRATLDLRLPQIATFAALAGQDVRGRAAFKAQIEQHGSDVGLSLDADADFSGGSAAWIGIVGNRAALKVSGSMSDRSFSLERAQLDGRALTLSASASAARPSAGGEPVQGGLESYIKDVKARWALEVSDLGVASAELGGKLQAEGTVSGTAARLAIDANLKSTVSIRGSPPGSLTAEVHARGVPSAPSATVAARGTLDSSPLELDASLERAGRKGLRANIQRADWKSAHLEGDWLMQSVLADSRGELRLTVGHLADFDRLLGTTLQGALDGRVKFTPQGGRTHAEFELSGSDLIAGPLSGTLRLAGGGDTDSVEAKLDAATPDFRGAPGSLTAKAVVNLGAHELRLVSAVADYRGQELKLLSAAKASYEKGFSIEDLRLGMQNAVLEFRGELGPALDLHASFQHVDPQLINAWLPDAISEGTADGRAHIQGSFSAPTGQIRINARGVRFADEVAAGLPALDLNAGAELNGSVASLDVRLNSGSTQLFTATGNVPLNADGAYDLKVSGKLDIAIANALFEARGMHIGGQLAVDATLGGTLADPQIRGTVGLAQGNFRDYARGLTLSNIAADIVGSEGRLQINSFKATAGSGTVAMTGSIGVLQPGMPVDVKITAAHAQPIASNILTANLNADIHVSGTARGRLDVAGSIFVNRAVIGIPDSLPPNVAVLDVRRRGKPVQAASKQLVIDLDVAINAPRQVLVQGRGLDAELGGDLHIGGTADVPIVSGRLDLQRGTFTIASTKLTFSSEAGQSGVSFDGTGLKKNIDPTLDFTATSANGATLRITGYADAPKFDLSSTTGQSQDEIMSQLLFGESPTQLTALQAAQVGAALATLAGVGGSGSNPLTRLQKTLGLDRLSVGAGTTTTAAGTTENSGAAIQAGRYISKRIYIEGKQSTAGQSQVEVDVDLTKHLKLQTRLGNGTAIQGTTPENDPGSSIGLQYQFEY